MSETGWREKNGKEGKKRRPGVYTDIRSPGMKGVAGGCGRMDDGTRGRGVAMYAVEADR